METKKKKGNVVRKRKSKNSFRNLPKPMKVRLVTDNADLTPDGQQVQQSTSGDQQQPRMKKLKNVSFEDIQEGDTDTDDYYLLVKYKIFKDLFTKVAACPKCNLRTVIISDKLNERMGVAYKIILYCSEKNCDYKDELYMDNLCKTERCTQGRQPYESNVRAIIGFHEIGHGHSGMRNVLRYMNVHPISSSAFTSLNEQVAVAYDKAANNSVRNAATEVRQKNPVPNPCIITYSTCRVSVDGSWQRHASLNGLVTCISEGKCIDIQ